MPYIIPDVPVDSDGLVLNKHIASDHVDNGEVTLCGYYIDYHTWKGHVSNVDDCPACRDIDA